jgi:thiamine kinase-like enzyme
VHRIPAPAELGVADLAAVCRRYLESLEKETLGAQGRSRLEGILQRAPSLEAGTFVHGDAFPENFIHDRDRIWLVDWEYAGRGHPAADLAYLAVTLGIAADGLRALVEAHGGADVETVRDLLPLAAARDLLWCLAETQARGSTPALSLYTELSRKRLGL